MDSYQKFLKDTEDFIFISAILKVIGAVIAVLMSFGVAIRKF